MRAEAYGQQDNNNNNNNNNYQNSEAQFFVGPYCDAQTSNLYLGAYYDEYCSNPADASYFMSLNYGNGFPFFYEPILAAGQCIDCVNTDEAEQGDDDGYPEANQLCQASIEEALYQCDDDRGYQNGCYFLSTTLPCYDGRECPTDSDEADDSSSSSSSGGGGSTSASDKIASTKEQFSKWFSWDGLEAEEQTLVAIGLACALFLFIVMIIGCTCWCRRGASEPATSRRDPLLLARREPMQNDPVLSDRSIVNGIY